MTINLIPPKLKKEKEYKKIVGVCVSSLFVLFLVCLIVTATIMADNFFQSKDRISLNQKIDQQKRLIKTYSEIEAQINQTNQKLSNLDNLNNGRVLWSEVISELARSTPGAVQIKNLVSNAESKKLTMTGTAKERRDIAKFKEKLENSSAFTDVVFTSSSHNAETNDFSWSLSCELEEKE